MDLSPFQSAAALIGLALSSVALIKVVSIAWRIVAKVLRRVSGALDALLGRDPIVDPADGREVSPALPGIGQRMSTVEDAVKTLTEVVAEQKELRDRVEVHEARLNVLEPTVATLISSSELTISAPTTPQR